MGSWQAIQNVSSVGLLSKELAQIAQIAAMGLLKPEWLVSFDLGPLFNLHPTGISNGLHCAAHLIPVDLSLPKKNVPVILGMEFANPIPQKSDLFEDVPASAVGMDTVKIDLNGGRTHPLNNLFVMLDARFAFDSEDNSCLFRLRRILL